MDILENYVNRVYYSLSTGSITKSNHQTANVLVLYSITIVVLDRLDVSMKLFTRIHGRKH